MLPGAYGNHSIGLAVQGHQSGRRAKSTHWFPGCLSDHNVLKYVLLFLLAMQSQMVSFLAM
jgi:hypothetical protein